MIKGPRQFKTFSINSMYNTCQIGNHFTFSLSIRRSGLPLVRNVRNFMYLQDFTDDATRFSKPNLRQLIDWPDVIMCLFFEHEEFEKKNFALGLAPPVHHYSFSIRKQQLKAFGWPLISSLDFIHSQSRAILLEVRVWEIELNVQKITLRSLEGYLGYCLPLELIQ